MQTLPFKKLRYKSPFTFDHYFDQVFVYPTACLFVLLSVRPYICPYEQKL